MSFFQRDTAEGPVARSIQEMLDELKKIPHEQDDRTPLERVAEWTGNKAGESVERAGRFWSGAGGKLQRAVAHSNAVIAALADTFRKGPEPTDFKRSVGEMQLLRVETALKARDFADALKKAAPDRVSRIGMTHWIEAGGDAKKLRDWSVKARQRVEMSDDGN